MILKLGDSAPNFEDWKKGDSVIVDPTVTNDELVKKYPGGYDEIKPYLRYIPDPGKG